MGVCVCVCESVCVPSVCITWHEATDFHASVVIELFMSCGLLGEKNRTASPKKIELSGNRFFVFLLNIFIFLYPIHFEKVMEDHVKMKDDCSFLLYSCYKFIIPIGFYTTQTNHQSHSQTSVTDLLSHFSHMSFFQRNRKLGM